MEIGMVRARDKEEAKREEIQLGQREDKQRMICFCLFRDISILLPHDWLMYQQNRQIVMI